MSQSHQDPRAQRGPWEDKDVGGFRRGGGPGPFSVHLNGRENTYVICIILDTSEQELESRRGKDTALGGGNNPHN